MGTSDFHHEIYELDGLRVPNGLAAVGLYLRTGQWTGANERTGVVPEDVAASMSGGDQVTIERVFRAGLWEMCPEGYRLLRGPHFDPDVAMPLWRYTDDDLCGRLYAIDDTPDT